MSDYNDGHLAACDVCAKAISEPPRPFDEDLCHMTIHPEAWIRNDAPIVQCPHLVVPRSKFCEHHLKAAVDEYVRLIERTAPFN